MTNHAEKMPIKLVNQSFAVAVLSDMLSDANRDAAYWQEKNEQTAVFWMKKCEDLELSLAQARELIEVDHQAYATVKKNLKSVEEYREREMVMLHEQRHRIALALEFIDKALCNAQFPALRQIRDYLDPHRAGDKIGKSSPLIKE